MLGYKNHTNVPLQINFLSKYFDATAAAAFVINTQCENYKEQLKHMNFKAVRQGIQKNKVHKLE